MRGILVSAILLSLSVDAAMAQQVQGLCGDRREMQQRLTGRDNVQPTQVDRIGSNLTVERIESDTGRWSILLNQPDGSSCVVDQGEPGEQRRPPLRGR